MWRLKIFLLKFKWEVRWFHFVFSMRVCMTASRRSGIVMWGIGTWGKVKTIVLAGKGILFHHTRASQLCLFYGAPYDTSKVWSLKSTSQYAKRLLLSCSGIEQFIVMEAVKSPESSLYPADPSRCRRWWSQCTMYMEVRLSSYVQEMVPWVPWVSPVPKHHILAVRFWKPPWMVGNV